MENSSKTETRDQRKARLAEETETQRELDFEAINEQEILHGDSNIATVELPYSEGLPVVIAGRIPRAIEIKRYRTQLAAATSAQGADLLAYTKAGEDIGTLCCVYPADKATLDKIKELRPLAMLTLGKQVVALADAKAKAEGKG